ncbi:MAG: hypothetical protein ACP5HU_05910 [Phycisphaerae bacterium]
MCFPARARPIVVAAIALTLSILVQAAPADQPTPSGADEWTKPVPLSFSVDYTLVSDYIFRGINFSEYPGEGREDLNHQLGVGLEYDTGDLGAFGASVWFEWFAGQEALTAGDSSNLQEVDYSVYWSYELERIAATLELGYIAYQFPRLSGDAECTHEFYASLGFDDSSWFGTEAPVLNPTVTFYQDVDDFRGSWLEIGVSHDFALGDYEATAGAPLLKDLTVTPSLTLGIDHRWMAPAVGNGQKSTRLGNLLYGMDVVYDLSSALDIPDAWGEFSVGGFLYYSQALRSELIDDELFGGMTVSWAW